jgi:hypothetical protein
MVILMTKTEKKKIELHHLFMDLQKEMCTKIETIRKRIEHGPSKGTGVEEVWNNWFKEYLPTRYTPTKAFVVDSTGQISDEIDIVIYDRHFSPFLFNHEGAQYIPAESVYAIFEIKQDLNKEHFKYASDKIASVRNLIRTSDKITHAGGVFPPRPPIPILAGILTYDSDWNPIFGEPFKDLIKGMNSNNRIDLGCAITKGSFEIEYLDCSYCHKALDAKNTLKFNFSKEDDALIFYLFDCSKLGLFRL